MMLVLGHNRVAIGPVNHLAAVAALAIEATHPVRSWTCVLVNHWSKQFLVVNRQL